MGYTHNVNQNITTGSINIEDVYDDIYAMSDGNSSCIYQLKIIDGDIYYGFYSRIDDNTDKNNRVIYQKYSGSGICSNWIHTTYTDKLNIDYIRDKKLDILLG